VRQSYSGRWRATFGAVEPERTAREVEFLTRVLPLPALAHVLDAPCGSGRHMRELVRCGYSVKGVDNDPAVVAEARAAGLDVDVRDLRALDDVGEPFDAAVCMWASFGYFDAATNDRVLAGFARLLRSGGRLVLDIYDRAFWEAHQGVRDNRGVRETTAVKDGRLRTELDYGEGVEDVFEWQLYSPTELVAAAAQVGLAPLVVCADFDVATPPSGEQPRMQVVFMRRP
jgi:SAM-dependent methyltransferase